MRYHEVNINFAISYELEPKQHRSQTEYLLVAQAFSMKLGEYIGSWQL